MKMDNQDGCTLGTELPWPPGRETAVGKTEAVKPVPVQQKKGMKRVPLSAAIGKILDHDITEVNRSNSYKGVAFKRGHVIREEDLPFLKRLGKEHIYIWNGSGVDVHEDEAACLLAPKIAGDNIAYDDEPREGKISFYATTSGIFKVDRQRLEQINALAIPSLPTIHNNFPVGKGKQVAAFRIIPLTCTQEIINRMMQLLASPLISIKPYRIRTASILVTGNEVYSGRIKDDFTPLLTAKLKHQGVKVTYKTVLPDIKADISRAIRKCVELSELILITGGTSVDPDDVTVAAMREAGVRLHEQGNPIQPGNNFTIGKIDAIPVCAVPAAALFFEKTALDIFLPRLLAGEQVSAQEVARSGHGGLCHFCPKCHYPICPFGWGGA